MTRNKSSQVYRKDMLEQYKKLSAVSIDMADNYFQSQLNSLLRENEDLNKRLEEKDIVIKDKDVVGKEKEQLFNKLLEAKEVSINEKEKESMTSKGLLTARGILEAMLRKCLIEMKVLGLVKETEKDNMTNIIQHLTKKEKHFPETSKCYLLVQSAKKCGCDLQSLYVTLCSSIHGAPWYGSSIKIFSKALREEDTCLLKAIADDMSLPYDLQE